jgi:hypothetical protein
VTYEEKLRIFERRILRRIYGHVKMVSGGLNTMMSYTVCIKI